jgi:hypothetical protein
MVGNLRQQYEMLYEDEQNAGRLELTYVVEFDFPLSANIIVRWRS